MPRLEGVKEWMYQPLWDSWRHDMGLPPPELMLFSGTNLGNKTITNMQIAGRLVSDRSAKLSRIGIFASFDDPALYQEFWRSAKIELIVGRCALLDLFARDVHVPDGHNVSHDGIPDPTHAFGFMGWIDLDRAVEIGLRCAFGVKLMCGDALIKMLGVRNGEQRRYSDIKVFLDTTFYREVL